MPGRDGTGPMGTGPRGGRGAGQGKGSDAANAVNQGLRGRHGRGGQGRGGGGRRGRRNMFHATGLTGWQRAAADVTDGAATVASPQPELPILQTQVEAVAATLDQIRERLDELAAEEAPPASPGHEPSSLDA